MSRFTLSLYRHKRDGGDVNLLDINVSFERRSIAKTALSCRDAFMIISRTRPLISHRDVYARIITCVRVGLPHA
jgi:hypothetical protein